MTNLFGIPPIYLNQSLGISPHQIDGVAIDFATDLLRRHRCSDSIQTATDQLRQISLGFLKIKSWFRECAMNKDSVIFRISGAIISPRSNSGIGDGGAGWGKTGIVDAAGILVGQDVRDVGDVVEKFTGAPRGAGGNLPQRSVIIGVGPPLRRRA
jgi:hypothetical protein